MRGLFVVLTLALAGSPSAAEVCAPATLTKVVTRSVGPDIAPGTFRAAPVTLFRQGDRFVRIEEAPDPTTGAHLLSVVAEPDIWMVNLADRTGRHIVDPGPSLIARAPIVAGQGVPPEFVELEFGCEAAFAERRGYDAGTRQVGGTLARIRALVIGSHRLEVLLSPQGVPAEVAYYRGDRTILVIRYDVYQTRLPDAPELFRRPEGITYETAPAPR